MRACARACVRSLLFQEGPARAETGKGLKAWKKCDEGVLESAAVVPCTTGPGNAVVSGVTLAEVVELLREELDQQDEVRGELACV